MANSPPAHGLVVARSGDPDVAVIPEGPYVVPFARKF